MPKRTNNQKGSALIIAMVVMLVLTVLGLSLMYASYSLFATVNRQQSAEQCRLMARSVSEEIEQELTGVSFVSQEEFEAALIDRNSHDEHPLWYYLRFNLLHLNPDEQSREAVWKYYNEVERDHKKLEKVQRKFKLTADSGEAKTVLDGYDITILIHWESEAGASRFNSTPVIIQVISEKDRQRSVITSTYELNVDYYAGENIGFMHYDSTYNPNQLTINSIERWTFSCVLRE